MTRLNELSAVTMQNGLKNGDFTHLELIDSHIEAIHTASELNAFITPTHGHARALAKKHDLGWKKNVQTDSFSIPVAVKDVFCTKNIATTAGSGILKNFVPPYESTVTERLWNTGAILMGKTNLDEFAMGSSNENSYFGPVINPWKRKNDSSPLTAGGSSGGSAAAVSACLCPIALGTDTGGSVRQPASYTGIVGMKPTYGRCSRWGIVAYASSLDQAGLFARSVEDVAYTLGIIASHDPKDSTSVPHKVPNYLESLRQGVKGLTIGIPQEYRTSNLPEEIRKQWQQGEEWLKAAGANIVNISLPHTSYALATYYIVATAEASSNLARYDGVRYGERVEHKGDNLINMYERTRAQGFGMEVKRRMIIGTYVLSSGYYDAYYLKAQKVRTLIKKDFQTAFEKVDAILTPTAPSSAFRLNENLHDPVAMYLNDIFTVPASLAGIPGISIPAGLDASGAPLGLQILGRPFDEETLFKIAHVMEDAATFNKKPANWWRTNL